MPIQKYLFFLVLFLLPNQFAFSQKLTPNAAPVAVVTEEPVRTDYLTANLASIRDSIVNYGKLFLNTPYRYGSNGTSYFDCSGFTSYVYRNFGYNLDRCSADQAKQFQSINRENLKTGDLVFFSGRRKSKTVGHVGIIVSAQEGNFEFIHASVSSGVTISKSDEAYYSSRFISANRVISKNDLLATATEKELREFSDNQAISPVKVNVKSQYKHVKKTKPAEYHKVKQGETLSSIALKYGITIAELKKKNDLQNSKIKPKQRILIKEKEIYTEIEEVLYAENALDKTDPINKSTIEKNTDKISDKADKKLVASTVTAVHKVKKGETLYSLSKQYYVAIDELKKLNKLSGNGLHIDDEIRLMSTEQELALKETEKNDQNKLLAEAKSNVKGAKQDSTSNAGNVAISAKKNLADQAQKKITHKVGPGDTFYSIAKTYGCTVNKLKEWNHKLDNKIKKGDVIIVYTHTI